MIQRRRSKKKILKVITRPKRYSLIEFDKTEYVDKELIDKITLWMLRIIVNLGGHKEFLSKDNSIYEEYIAYFLDIGHYCEMDGREFNRDDLLSELNEKLMKLERKKRFGNLKILSNNIKKISKLLQLNSYEEQIFEFVLLLNLYEILSDTLSFLDKNLNRSQLIRAMSKILNIPKDAINKALQPDSKLIRSSLIEISHRSSKISDHLMLLSFEFTENMCNLEGDITLLIKYIIRRAPKSTLKLEDYHHIEKDIDILLPYLKHALSKQKEGVNILLYGIPGTGKTELSRVIAKSLNAHLFEVSYSDENGDTIDGQKRLKAYKMAQHFLANQNTLLLYDEAEDIFDSFDSLFSPKKQSNKAWINKALETNKIPTIWITNDIGSIDNAIVRRFDLTIELPIPSKSQRAKLIKKETKDILDDESIKLISENDHIAPAIINRAVKVVNSIECGDKTSSIKQLINNTLKAQGYNTLIKDNTPTLPKIYDPKFINTDANLNELVEGIKQCKNARLCLYGPAGTGKSAFGKYIAQVLDRPYLLKKGSDLLNMYVGGTEKNIAKAFEMASQDNSVLIFDEIDSFLADRSKAHRNWEITQVNEMLTQMESFDGVFIATTNLMENLDQASLRRFDLKLEFGYLKREQAWKLFCSYSKELGLENPTNDDKESIKDLKSLTPGDFAALIRQNRFKPIKDIEDFIRRLKSEVKLKDIESCRVMGFK